MSNGIEVFPQGEALQFDPKILAQIVEEEYKNLNSLMIVKGGNLVYEQYNHGYAKEDTQHVASITKSIMSILVGMAIDQGHIKNEDEGVVDFFPEYKIFPRDLVKNTISIKDILTMTAPFAFSIKSMETRPFEPLDRLRRQPDWTKYILSIMGKGSHIGQFQYSTPSVHLLSAIITKTTGMSARAFGNKYLFEPLGIKAFEDIEMKSFRSEDLFGERMSGWVHDPKGITIGGWGLTLSPVDMAKIGQLYLQMGEWKGQQLISKGWVEKSTSNRENENDYGYLWWLKNIEGVSTYAALGYGGNMIACVPDGDLLIVATGKMTAKIGDPYDLIKKIIQMQKK